MIARNETQCVKQCGPIASLLVIVGDVIARAETQRKEQREHIA